MALLLFPQSKWTESQAFIVTIKDRPRQHGKYNLNLLSTGKLAMKRARLSIII